MQLRGSRGAAARPRSGDRSRECHGYRWPTRPAARAASSDTPRKHRGFRASPGMPPCHARMEPREPAIATGGRGVSARKFGPHPGGPVPAERVGGCAGLPSVVERELALRRVSRGCERRWRARYAVRATARILRLPPPPLADQAVLLLRRWRRCSGTHSRRAAWAQVQRVVTPARPAGTARRTARRAPPVEGTVDGWAGGDDRADPRPALRPARSRSGELAGLE